MKLENAGLFDGETMVMVVTPLVENHVHKGFYFHTVNDVQPKFDSLTHGFETKTAKHLAGVNATMDEAKVLAKTFYVATRK